MPIVVSICSVLCTLITVYYAVTSLAGIVFCKRRERAQKPAQKLVGKRSTERRAVLQGKRDKINCSAPTLHTATSESH